MLHRFGVGQNFSLDDFESERWIQLVVNVLQTYDEYVSVVERLRTKEV